VNRASVRGRIGLGLVLVAFLIPISAASLGGLTQVVTCQARARNTVATVTSADTGSIVLGSDAVERAERPLCGRLVLVTQVRFAPGGRLDLRVGLRNESRHPWHGTVHLALHGASTLYTALGTIAPGRVVYRSIEFTPPHGRSDIPLEVLVGP
jgi:hypothetical protein